MILNDKEIIKKLLSHFGHERFIFTWEDGRWYTYDEFWEVAAIYADILEREHLKEIAAVMDNGIHLCRLYFACMLSNTVIVPIDPQKASEEIDDILKEHPGIKVLTNADPMFIWDKEDDRNFILGNNVHKKIEDIDLRKTYMITYTSGSTGKAKGVKHSLRNLFLASEAFGGMTGLDEKYTMCHVMPMTYMAGILNTIFMPFFRGSKIVILPRFNVMSAISFWRNVQQNGVNAFWFSPTMLNILMTIDRKGSVREYLSKTDTLFYVGTAPLYESVRTKFQDRYGVTLLQSYGLSETLFLSTEVPGAIPDHVSVGNLLPGVDMNISSEQEIGVNVPWMFQGYMNEKTEDYFLGKYYMTGDLGAVQDGRLFITGRKKDLIIKGGMNISPKQIEDCILKTDGIEECVVAGAAVNDEERIICWYVLSSGKHQITESGINKEIERSVGKHCKIDIFKKVSEIPKNINGKADKKRLMEEIVL